MITRYKTDEKGKIVPLCNIYSQSEHPIRNKDIDSDALYAIKKIKAKGGEAFIVGGAIRDILLNRKPKDFDIATSLSPRSITRLFPNSMIIGRRFRIVHLIFNNKIIEVTTFRSDEENFEEGHNNIFGTIEQDAKRRDFSINSLYYDPEKCEVLDFSNAMEDFKYAVIRSLIPLEYSFHEDPVRMIRAIKYSVTTGFKMKSDVKSAIRKYSSSISSISPSRLTDEVKKILYSSNSKEIMDSLYDYHLLQYMMPSFSSRYKSSLDSLSKLDEKIRNNGKESVSSTKVFYFLLKDLLLYDKTLKEEEERKDLFRQIKVLLSPISPSNVELEKVVTYFMEDQGLVKKERKKKKKK